MFNVILYVIIEEIEKNRVSISYPQFHYIQNVFSMDNLGTVFLDDTNDTVDIDVRLYYPMNIIKKQEKNWEKRYGGEKFHLK